MWLQTYTADNKKNILWGFFELLQQGKAGLMVLFTSEASGGLWPALARMWGGKPTNW
jgi:hypothetical protein